MYIAMYQIIKSKMVRCLKFKFLNTIKLIFNGVQFYKKILNFDYSKNCKFCRYIKFEIENGKHLC